MWGSPETPSDVAKVFAQYCQGAVPALPWSDSPLSAESESIVSFLVRCNQAGYLTINSQPAVDGVSSHDPVYGWGPKNGFVYQKAYLEFFVSPTQLESLLKKLDGHPSLTYHAVSKSGDLQTNAPNAATAVTWGVFPGTEILQPTIVEPESFMAWKVRLSLYHLR